MYQHSLSPMGIQNSIRAFVLEGLDDSLSPMGIQN